MCLELYSKYYVAADLSIILQIQFMRTLNSWDFCVIVPNKSFPWTPSDTRIIIAGDINQLHFGRE